MLRQRYMTQTKFVSTDFLSSFFLSFFQFVLLQVFPISNCIPDHHFPSGQAPALPMAEFGRLWSPRAGRRQVLASDLEGSTGQFIVAGEDSTEVLQNLSKGGRFLLVFCVQFCYSLIIGCNQLHFEIHKRQCIDKF